MRRYFNMRAGSGAFGIERFQPTTMAMGRVGGGEVDGTGAGRGDALGRRAQVRFQTSLFFDGQAQGRFCREVFRRQFPQRPPPGTGGIGGRVKQLLEGREIPIPVEGVKGISMLALLPGQADEKSGGFRVGQLLRRFPIEIHGILFGPQGGPDRVPQRLRLIHRGLLPSAFSSSHKFQ
jgi:hypothetical protein